MKAAEHKRIMKDVVSRKNRQIENVKAVLGEEVEFWQKESEDWCNVAATYRCLLAQVRREFDTLSSYAENDLVVGPNEDLLAKIDKMLYERE